MICEMCIRDRFSGNYQFGNVWNTLGGVVTGNGKYDFLNSALQVVGLGAATPVSYTHLDVYKRQALYTGASSLSHL